MKILLFFILLPVLNASGSIFPENNEFAPVDLMEQQRTVTGRVTDADENSPLPGVSIVIEGTTTGTVTGSDGEYSISVPGPEALLRFSFVGYISQEIIVGDNNVINVSLQEDIRVLDEVVVVGYGTETRRRLTSSVSSVNTEEAIKISASSVAQTLAGRAAGLTATLSSAQVGGAVNLQIRGAATGRSPLIIIDGMPTTNFRAATGGRFDVGDLDAVLSTLNPNDIASIDILKDASATAIYGSQAAGGVILITTKKGRAIADLAGSVDVNFSAKTGLQNYYRIPEMLDAVGYMTEYNRVQREQWFYDSRDGIYSHVPKPTGWIQPEPFVPGFSEAEINAFRTGQEQSTDYVDQVTRQGSVQEYDLSVSGNHQNTRFYTSFNAFRQNGIIKDNAIDKYTGRINVEQNFGSNLIGGINMSYGHQLIDNVALGRGAIAESAGIFKGALRFSPMTPVYDEFGNFGRDLQAPSTPNPVSHLAYENFTNIDRFLSTAFLNYRLTSNLTFRTQFGFDRNESELNAYLPTSHQTGASVGGRADMQERVHTNYQAQATLNHTYVFGSGELHSLNTVVGSEYMKYKRRGSSIQATGFPFDGALWYNLALAANRPIVGSFGGSDEVLSFFGRTSYSFDDKYLVTINLRVDGSSNFAPENQFGFFPGVSAGWDLTRESFMNFSRGWLNQLKLRAGYGITGNDDIGYAFTDWYNPGARAQWGGNIISGVRVAGLGNPQLTWEQQEDINVGLDFSILNNRIYGEFDVFSRKISRILGNQQIGTWNPVTTIQSNLDAVKQTYGTEFTLNTINASTPVFSWNSIMTFTYYRDRWLQRDPNYVLQIWESPRAYFNEVWHYKSDGIAPLDSTDPLNPVPGTVRVLDLNGYLLDEAGNRVMDEDGRPMYSGEPDGRIDAADLVYIGTNQPFTIGFNNSFRFRQFDFSFYAYGMFNQWSENFVRSRLGGRMTYSIVDRGINLHTSVLDRFNSDYLEGTGVSSLQNTVSGFRSGGDGDYFMEKSWFIRMRNITLGYSMQTRRMGNVRVFGSIDNAFIITPYTGMDPETDTYLGSYPPQRTISFGAQFRL